MLRSALGAAGRRAAAAVGPGLTFCRIDFLPASSSWSGGGGARSFAKHAKRGMKKAPAAKGVAAEGKALSPVASAWTEVAQQGQGGTRLARLVSHGIVYRCGARHLIHHVVYRRSPRHPPHSGPAIASSSRASKQEPG
jgi:hypothetical protein